MNNSNTHVQLSCSNTYYTKREPRQAGVDVLVMHLQAQYHHTSTACAATPTCALQVTHTFAELHALFTCINNPGHRSLRLQVRILAGGIRLAAAKHIVLCSQLCAAL